MGGNKTTQRNKSNFTQTSTNSENPWVKENIFPDLSTIKNNIMTVAPPPTQTLAAPGQAQQVAQHEQLTGPTVVAPHQQSTIDNASQQSANIGGMMQPTTQNVFTAYNNISQGPDNTYVNAQKDALKAWNDENLAKQNSIIQQNASGAGAVGSGDVARAQAWNNQANTTSYNAQLADYEAQNYNNWVATMGQLPTWMQNAANAGMWDANNQITYGDMTQQNAQAEASNNLNQTLWNYGMAQDQAAQTNANTAWQQQVDQTGLTNNYQNWIDQMGLNQSQLSNLAAIESMVLGAGNTTTSGQSDSTTTTQTKTSPLADAAGILGAGMSLFAPGSGMFGGLLKGLGGAAGAAGGAAGGALAAGSGGIGMGTGLPSWYTPSDRRLKKDIKPIGDGWYEYRYLWDPPGTKHVGVMADEVDPKYVIRHPAGFDMVDYGALMAGG